MSVVPAASGSTLISIRPTLKYMVREGDVYLLDDPGFEIIDSGKEIRRKDQAIESALAFFKSPIRRFTSIVSVWNIRSPLSDSKANPNRGSINCLLAR